MKKIKLTKSIIPNSFTAFNIFFGFASIVMASEGKIITAAILIIAAAICDALDGLMARLTKSSSQFGVELDSLADMVSFGAAPSFLSYVSYFHNLGIVGIVLSSLPVIFGGFRLARFNVQLEGFTKDSFKGLPIPFAAMTLISFVSIYHRPDGFISPFGDFFIPLIILVSVLMVTDVKYDTIPKLNIEGIKEKPLLFIFSFISIIILIITKGEAIFFVLLSAILLGILRQIYYSISNKEEFEVNK